MTNRFFTLVTALLIVVWPSNFAQTQDLGSEEGNRWLSYKKIHQGEPFFPGIVIAQIEPTRSLNIGITQVRRMSDTGWFAPLWRNFNYDVGNTLRPLFAYNSQEYSDSILTDLFKVKENDTISFFTPVVLLLPPWITSRDTGLYNVRFKHSLDYIVDLVNLKNERLALVDSIHFAQTDSIADFFENLWTHSYEWYSSGNISGLDQRFIISSSLDGMDVSLRVLFKYNGPDSTRWVEREDVWLPYYDMNDSTLINAFYYAFNVLCPHIVGCDTSLGKRNQSLMGISHPDYHFAVYPDPGVTSHYHLYAKNLDPSTRVQIKIVSASGVEVRNDYYVTNQRGFLNATVDLSRLASGVYFFILTSDIRYYTVKLVRHLGR